MWRCLEVTPFCDMITVPLNCGNITVGSDHAELWGKSRSCFRCTIRFQLDARCQWCAWTWEELQAGYLGAGLLKYDFSRLLVRYLEHSNGIPIICALNAGCMEQRLCMDYREINSMKCVWLQPDWFLFDAPQTFLCTHSWPPECSQTGAQPWCHLSWVFRG